MHDVTRLPYYLLAAIEVPSHFPKMTKVLILILSLG